MKKLLLLTVFLMFFFSFSFAQAESVSEVASSTPDQNYSEVGILSGTRLSVPVGLSLLRNCAHMNKVKVETDEDWGWLFVTIRFTLTGKKEDVIKVVNQLNVYQKIEEENLKKQKN